jgi:hypothetical protein
MGAYFLYLGVILFWAVVFVRNRGFSLIIKEPIILFRGVGGVYGGHSYMSTWNLYMNIHI